MGKVSDEWFDVSKQYYDAFGDGFPSEMYAGSESDMIALMRECIEKGEPFDPPQLDDGGCALVY